MEHRRIAIYLGGRKQVAQVQFNHLYTSKMDLLLAKTGDTKTELARRLLMEAFQTDNVSELKERIYYAAEVNEDVLEHVNISVKRRIAEVVKKAIKFSIDKGYLL